MNFNLSARGTAALRLALLASLAGSPAMAQVMAAADQAGGDQAAPRPRPRR
ncbi:hypothetical protein [Sandarakinorhabdus limnophila]|uniref:hypothetical protein n=1 Tax=Sandarakinorhabdus limnophila TaxID=210512 RepID=UPI003137B427